jgi:hypothetical protein
MFPPNTVWAKLKHPDPEIMAIPAVADYFEKVSRKIHNIMVSSNFAQQEFESLLCMGCFGTTCLSVEEDDKKVVKFRNYTISKVRIAENYQGEIDTVGRKFSLSSRQAIQQFGEKALIEAELDKIVDDAKSYKDTEYDFIHYVCPREDFNTDKKDKLNKPFASFYVCTEGDKIVSEGGFDYDPYKTARFVTGNDETYGRSPQSMVLGTSRRSNVMERSVIVSAEQHTNPQWLTPDDDSVKGLSSRAGAVIKYRANHPSGKPERLPPNGDPQIGVELLDRYENRIEKFYFTHLFRPLEDYRNMTAFEVSERMVQDLMSLAPFVSRYEDDKVTPTVEMVYYFAQKQGKLPPPPIELSESPEFEIEYVGKLSLATKSFETLGAINTIRIFTELGAGDPRALQGLDNVDWDKFFKELWFSNSSSMNALKDVKTVEKERAERKLALNKQQAIDNLAPIADAAQKTSGAVDPTSIVAQQMGQ